MYNNEHQSSAIKKTHLSQTRCQCQCQSRICSVGKTA